MFTYLTSSFITCASLGILENRAGPPPHQYFSSFGISPRHDRIYPQRLFDFYGRYLYPYAISHIQQFPCISRQRNLTVNHIYRYRPRVLPITQAQLHAYGVHYLSPYKIHRSIFARVGHRVFKPYFHHLLRLTFLQRTDYVTLLILIRFLHLGVDNQLIIFVSYYLFPGRPSITHRVCSFTCFRTLLSFFLLSLSNPPLLPGLTPALVMF